MAELAMEVAASKSWSCPDSKPSPVCPQPGHPLHSKPGPTAGPPWPQQPLLVGPGSCPMLCTPGQPDASSAELVVQHGTSMAEQRCRAPCLAPPARAAPGFFLTVSPLGRHSPCPLGGAGWQHHLPSWDTEVARSNVHKSGGVCTSGTSLFCDVFACPSPAWVDAGV